jgi:hypothetical protein
VDEAIRLFRANVMFRNFEVLGGGDRVLVYLTLFIHQVRRGCGQGPWQSPDLTHTSCSHAPTSFPPAVHQEVREEDQGGRDARA